MRNDQRYNRVKVREIKRSRIRERVTAIEEERVKVGERES
jgi:hypothetical protein